MADLPLLTLADQVLVNAAGWLCTATVPDDEAEERVMATVARWLPHATLGHPRLDPVLAKLRLLLPDATGADQIGAHRGTERAVVVMGLRREIAALLLWRMDVATEKLTGGPGSQGKAA